MLSLDEQEQLARKIAHEWMDDNGFLFQYRGGVFDLAGERRLLDLLSAIDLRGASVVSYNLVSQVWFIPQFLEWNWRRHQSGGYAEGAKRLCAEVWEIVRQAFADRIPPEELQSRPPLQAE